MTNGGDKLCGLSEAVAGNCCGARLLTMVQEHMIMTLSLLAVE